MTLDEARLMANINARARRLFEDGYRARWMQAGVLEVRGGKGGTYRLETERHTCDCPFFVGHQGRHPCKHLLGWKRLLVRQRACRRLLIRLLVRDWADLDDASTSCEADVPKIAAGSEAAHACL